jgi:hypothetical protein
VTADLAADLATFRAWLVKKGYAYGTVKIQMISARQAFMAGCRTEEDVDAALPEKSAQRRSDIRGALRKWAECFEVGA